MRKYLSVVYILEKKNITSNKEIVLITKRV